MKVIKKNNTEEEFNVAKLISVLNRANNNLPKNKQISSEKIRDLVKIIVVKLTLEDKKITSSSIQSMTETVLIEHNLVELVKSYIIGCYENKLQYQMSVLDKSILDIISNQNTDVALENSNKNAMLNSTQRDYMAGEVSKSLTDRIYLTPSILKAEKKGAIHNHDKDYFVQSMTNCGLVNLKDMFEKGTNINGVQIETPKSLQTVATVASQIALNISSNQFGGQTMNLAHWVPYVDISRKKIKNRLLEEFKEIEIEVSDEKLNKLVEKELKKEIEASVQTFNYQINSMTGASGQSPFITLSLYLNDYKDSPKEKADLALLIEEFLKQRIKGIKNKAGHYVTQTFPKLIYVLEDDNVYKGQEYYWLTELAAECTAKRMVPDYISEKVMLEKKKNSKGESTVVIPMGCRSMLSVLENEPERTWGRFNLGVVTLNLPYIALESKGDIDEFWNLLDYYANLCKQSQLIRYKKLCGVPSDVAPVLWQHGAYARLKPGETIDKLLTKDNATVSLGYAGLFEAVKYLTGYSHTNTISHDFAISIMKKLNEYCDAWKEQTNLGWAVYGTPIESTTTKFAKACVRDFGTVDGENAREYITNSYHVHVTENINAFDKLNFESAFQELSTGGAISYVEVPNLTNNLEAVISVIQFIYEHIMYAELNCKTDFCYKCEYDGEIKPFYDEEGKPGWKCPGCGNTDTKTISVVRRTCGYLGSNSAGDLGWNSGRFSEIADRVLHL